MHRFYILLSFLLFVAISLFGQGEEATDICPLLIGSEVPAVNVTSTEGNQVSLEEITQDKPTVIIFYRGSWCPYCNRHFKEIASVESELKELGFQILAISPDKPENVMGTQEKHELAYELFSDSDMKVSDAFGLSFKVDDKTLAKYKTYGIDLDAASGRTHNRLPVPAVFIFGKDGRVKFNYANPDYHERLGGTVLLAAAKAALTDK